MERAPHGMRAEKPSVNIHEHCTAAEILVFGRETGFPTQTLQRWYMYVQVTPRNGNKLD
jgi:hypothetical protein